MMNYEIKFFITPDFCCFVNVLSVEQYHFKLS